MHPNAKKNLAWLKKFEFVNDILKGTYFVAKPLIYSNCLSFIKEFKIKCKTVLKTIIALNI